MNAWDHYPASYRSAEVQKIVASVCAGDCTAIIGLSGSGKSNLIGFIAHRITPGPGCPAWILVDCNRQIVPGASGFLTLLIHSVDPEWKNHLNPNGSDQDIFEALDQAIAARTAQTRGVCLLLDRFDALLSGNDFKIIANSLRSLRDRNKFRLTFVIASRRPLPQDNELAELFYDHTIWLGALQPNDAMWSARRDADRYTAAQEAFQRDWNEAVFEKLVAYSNGYPSLLRAACQAYSGGADLDPQLLRNHPAIKRRIEEFWSEAPSQEALELSGLTKVAWLMEARDDAPKASSEIDARLTAKEALLLEYFRAHPEVVCEKDELVQAVWPEDVIFARGIRDESLAQLIRRLRLKIETNPDKPVHIQTIPGRGYIFHI